MSSVATTVVSYGWLLFCLSGMIQLHDVNGCSPLIPTSAYIDDVFLLAASGSSLLLKINGGSNSIFESGSGKYCKVFNTNNGKTKDGTKNCKKADTIPWPIESTRNETTNTIIHSIVNANANENENNNSNGIITNYSYVINVERNAETFAIDFNTTDINVMLTTDYFLYWTLPSMHTTLIAFSTTDNYAITRLYAIAFASADSNTEYQVFEVEIRSNTGASPNDGESDTDTDWDWDNRPWTLMDPMPGGTDAEVIVFEKYNLLVSPMVCCICSNTVMLRYEYSSQQPLVFTLEYIAEDAVIDYRTDHAYTWGLFSKSIRIWDLSESGMGSTGDIVSKKYKPNISTAGYSMYATTKSEKQALSIVVCFAVLMSYLQ